MLMQRRARPVFTSPADAPICALNTTPLIDVMLVLLIMFILTVPIATHKVKVDLPSGPPAAFELPVTHELALDAGGALSWDGAAIAEAALPGRLAAARRQDPDMVLRLRADGATRYEAFDRVLASVKKSGVERLGFVGNEGFAAAMGLSRATRPAAAG
jgi:biopolymer transport protein ExbD